MSILSRSIASIFVGFCFLSISHAQEFSDAQKKEAEALVAQLEADSFAEREAAADKLEKLPSGALPWLTEVVDGTPKTELELRSRLKSIIRSLKKKDAETGLRDGSKVVIKLEDAGPEDFIAELDLKTGSNLRVRRVKVDWGKAEPKNIDFEGSYWDAIDHLFELFPPQAGGREQFSDDDYRLSSWTKEDFLAAAQPSVNDGIVRLRHGRFALESSGGKDWLLLTMVPSVEPLYQVDEIALMIKKIVLEDGTELKPEEKICRFEGGDRGNGSEYNPASLFTWVFPLEKGTRLKGVVEIEAIADVEVRRLDWIEVDLPEELNEKVKLNSSADLKVLERGDGRLKIEFEGSGNEPEAFDDYQLREEAYKVLDADGEELDFNVNSTSSGGGMKSWRTSFAGSIKGDPVRLRTRLPGAAQKVQLKFKLEDLSLPGSTLAD